MFQLRIQGTPNPNARKYVVSVTLKEDGKVSYSSHVECGHLPLAVALFEIAHVGQIHFFKNVLTVTKTPSGSWRQIDDGVQDALETHLAEHDPHFPERDSSQIEREPLEGDLAVVDEIIEKMIRPSLQADGGDLEVVALEGNILTVRYEGACGSCPSALGGTLAGIRQVLQDEYRSDLEVVAL